LSELGKKIYRLNRTLHRDFGHLLVGLTLLFAISGIALNHLHDFNPNYKITHVQKRVDQLAPSASDEQWVQHIKQSLVITEKLRHVHSPSPSERIIFFPNTRVELNIKSGVANLEQVVKRPLLFPLNQLHLNRAGIYWVYLSDIYAVLLIFLAISGLFMARGLRQKVKRRGHLMLLAGIIIPLIYWIYLSGGGASGS
jgi:uncharacterized protein